MLDGENQIAALKAGWIPLIYVRHPHQIYYRIFKTIWIKPSDYA